MVKTFAEWIAFSSGEFVAYTAKWAGICSNLCAASPFALDRSKASASQMSARIHATLYHAKPSILIT